MSYRGGIYEAIKSLQSYASFGLRNNDYDTLEWFDDPTVVPIPTREEVEAEHLRLKNLHETNDYQRKRALEYPPIGDQLDALWKGGTAAEEMLAKVQAVKNKYPKPELDL
jgi:hypothetical protein